VIGSMLEEANKLTKLVDSLLTIARADSGQMRLNPAEFPAKSLAVECRSLFEAVLEENGQTLSIQSVGDPMVYGDWLLLRQALVNIVHNAVKYTPKGGEIMLRVRAEGDQVVLEVEDSGPGIPKDKLSRVFDRFYRVEEGRSREAGGAGLGLSIAQWSVEIHQGRVTAFSDEGNGCTFRITLPRLTPPPATSEA
jgi:signal transduction histidine kinase